MELEDDFASLWNYIFCRHLDYYLAHPRSFDWNFRTDKQSFIFQHATIRLRVLYKMYVFEQIVEQRIVIVRQVTGATVGVMCLSFEQSEKKLPPFPSQSQIEQFKENISLSRILSYGFLSKWRLYCPVFGIDLKKSEMLEPTFFDRGVFS